MRILFSILIGVVFALLFDSLKQFFLPKQASADFAIAASSMETNKHDTSHEALNALATHLENTRIAPPQQRSVSYKFVREIIDEPPEPSESSTTITSYGVPEIRANEDSVYSVYEVDQPPTFPGGADSLKKYISTHLIWPAMARENGISGVVYIGFEVRKDSTLDHIKILKDIGGGCGEAAVRLIKQMPHWYPGLLGGQPVHASTITPVQFRLE